MYQRCPGTDNCSTCQRLIAQLGDHGPLTEESTRIRDEGVRAFMSALERGQDGRALQALREVGLA